MDFIRLYRTDINKKALNFKGFFALLDFIGFTVGGDAGIRTPDTADMSRML
jgi:hypothetical protein